MSFNQETVWRIAAERFIKAQAVQKAAAATRLERRECLRAEQEREGVRLRVERSLAKQKAREEAEAMERSVLAEVESWRHRTPLEVLQGEMREMKRQQAVLQNEINELKRQDSLQRLQKELHDLKSQLCQNKF